MIAQQKSVMEIFTMDAEEIERRAMLYAEAAMEKVFQKLKVRSLDICVD